MKKLLLLGVLLTLTACAPKTNRFAFLDTTAVDQATGVVWMKNANLPGKPLVWKGDDNVYAFLQKLNRENYAGYADWRAPTKGELEDLLKYAKKLGRYEEKNIETWPYKTLRQAGFADVRDYGYWTSTRKSPNEMWIADLASGEVTAKGDDQAYCLWPVRGGREK